MSEERRILLVMKGKIYKVEEYKKINKKTETKSRFFTMSRRRIK